MIHHALTNRKTNSDIAIHCLERSYAAANIMPSRCLAKAGLSVRIESCKTEAIATAKAHRGLQFFRAIS